MKSLSQFSLRAAVLGMALFSAGCQRAADASKQGPPGGGRRPAVPVRVAQAALADVPLDVQAIGNVEASSSVAVKARVAGRIDRVLVQDGQEVKEGEVLFKLDAVPFEEEVRLAEANIARDRALEKQAMAAVARDQAVARNARAQADRHQNLFKEGIAAREQAEQFRTAAEAAEAAVAADQAQIESARAAMRADEVRLSEARLRLSYTTIAAPAPGRAGFVAVKEGNLVKENDTPALVVLLRLQPVYVNFGVPEQALAEIRRHMAQGSLSVDAYMEDTPSEISTGKLTSIDNTVDQATGTIKLRATFPNAARTLWPGQFVNVRLRLRVENQVVTVPKRAVMNGADGTYSWIVAEDGTAQFRPVRVARERGDISLIAEGIKPGETLVTEGQLRVTRGAKLEILAAKAPSAN
ncbi:MAG: efflux RND transporter periplasmic adaptor subunit [Acidobacteria bacterium]|nr:efflux RND transporter periplasmic adaptor subunit [Acidobacteriota bacterium]